MQGDEVKVVDAETLIRCVEEMILLDELSEERKIEILQKLLSIAEGNSGARKVC